MNSQSHHLLGYPIYTSGLGALSLDSVKMINTINPHSYCIAQKDKVFAEALSKGDLLLPDGQGIVLAARLLMKKKIKRITGSDIHDFLLKIAHENKWSVFYLGSSNETLALIKNRLIGEFPGIKFHGFSPPFKSEFTAAENSEILKVINEVKPEILFIGMTAPKQEKWAFACKDQIDARHILSIGAAFDFYAGTVKRPGKVWQKLGLEWLPRLIGEPSRLWKRNFVSTPLFLYYVMRELLKRGRD